MAIPTCACANYFKNPLPDNSTCGLCARRRGVDVVQVDEPYCLDCKSAVSLCGCIKNDDDMISTSVTEIFDSKGEMDLRVGRSLRRICHYDRFKAFDFVCENRRKRDSTLTLVVVDNSPSMHCYMDRVRKQLIALVNDMCVGSVLSVVSFNGTANLFLSREIQTSTRSSIVRSLQMFDMFGYSTNYAAAIELGLVQLRDSQQDKKFVIFMTDDGDTCGFTGKVDTAFTSNCDGFRAVGFGQGKLLSKFMLDASLVVDGDDSEALQRVFDDVRRMSGMVQFRVIVPSFLGERDCLRFSGLASFDPSAGLDSLWVCADSTRTIFLLFEPSLERGVDSLASLDALIVGKQRIKIEATKEGDLVSNARRKAFLMNRLGRFYELLKREITALRLPGGVCPEAVQACVDDYAFGVQEFMKSFSLEMDDSDYKSTAALLMECKKLKKNSSIDYGTDSSADGYLIRGAKRARKNPRL